MAVTPYCKLTRDFNLFDLFNRFGTEIIFLVSFFQKIIRSVIKSYSALFTCNDKKIEKYFLETNSCV